MCTPVPMCFCVYIWDMCGSAVGDSTVFMCDSHIVSEEEVSLKCSNVPDRNAGRSVNSSSFHSECVFSEWVVSSVCSFTAGGGEILQRKKQIRIFFLNSCLVVLLCHWADFWGGHDKFLFLFFVFLLVKVVCTSCIWQSHPRLLTQDPPAPGRNSKDTKAIYHTTGTYTGFLVWVHVVYIYEIHT